MDAWKLVYSLYEQLYTYAIVHFRKVWNITKIHESCWKSHIETLKEKNYEGVDKPWILNHFGNTTKNINEYAHGRLKQYFKDSKCDPGCGWEAIHNMFT